jgi:hypothetical protein
VKRSNTYLQHRPAALRAGRRYGFRYRALDEIAAHLDEIAAHLGEVAGGL